VSLRGIEMESEMYEMNAPTSQVAKWMMALMTRLRVVKGCQVFGYLQKCLFLPKTKEKPSLHIVC
jgi:hypothetical protein